ncbi:MAG: DNA-protecting protein DprA [Planctomycetes bacterium]|nr:DNA-protecting protein DprA [Planctomycetota bacterium]
MPEAEFGDHFAAYSPEELLGPLNDVEKRNAPPRLFVAGDRSLLRFGARVSVVGSRKPSQAGIERARNLAAELAMRRISVVSGLAEGIDTVVHEACISAGGKTIAVLGTGLDDVFPTKNRKLLALITREHLAVTQFPPGVPARRGNFPMRNRTMALLSDATVIVEAGEKSGTLHQGWEALRLGRLLFIAESLLQDRSLSWPAQLARYGALALPSTESLLELLPETSRVEASKLTF